MCDSGQDLRHHLCQTVLHASFIWESPHSKRLFNVSEVLLLCNMAWFMRAWKRFGTSSEIVKGLQWGLTDGYEFVQVRNGTFFLLIVQATSWARTQGYEIICWPPVILRLANVHFSIDMKSSHQACDIQLVRARYELVPWWEGTPGWAHEQTLKFKYKNGIRNERPAVKEPWRHSQLMCKSGADASTCQQYWNCDLWPATYKTAGFGSVDIRLVWHGQRIGALSLTSNYWRMPYAVFKTHRCLKYAQRVGAFEKWVARVLHQLHCQQDLSRTSI